MKIPTSRKPRDVGHPPSYTYDAAGNRLSKTDQASQVTSNYAYDPIYQLLQVTQGATTTESYSYDLVGNRLSSLGVSPYVYNSSNQLTSTPTATYTYDNNGSTKTKVDGTGTTTYNWDWENRLSSVVLPAGGGTVSFKYDPFGRRIQKSGPLGTTNYLYDGFNLLEEVDNSGNVLGRYTQTTSLDESLSEIRSGTTSYYEADGLGSITSLSNGSGALANTYSSDSFGNLTASTGTVTNPFRFTGREFDSETGMYEYRARYLDQTTGRFIGEDPIRLRGNIDFYAYLGNNPVKFVDPTGYAPCLDIDAFVKALDNNAQPYSTGWCGRYVGRALAAGGANVGSHNGKDYGPYLSDAGFSEVPLDGYQPQAGDVAVVQPYPGGNQAGHVAGYDGTNWVSDFPQSGLYPGPGYRLYKPPYAICRPTPCATSPAEQSIFQRIINWFTGLF
ncbi:MAG TPA: RHS repeat-associated core domain-containing protein [Terriglobales bacterium]|jgi:RHS repeat-associated protein|nr:RHS repeat-associated core domain-containing protein [Terriglobales bacterium]